jgi:hypothetical protein
VRRRDAIRAGLAAVGVGALGRPAVGETAAFRPRGRLKLAGAKEAVVGPDGETAAVATTDGYATVDLTDPTAPRLLAERRGLLADRETGALDQIYDVKRDGDTLAVVGPANFVAGESTNGVLFVDISDPADPTQLGFHPTTFPIHNCAFADGHAFLTGNGSAAADGVQRNELVVVAADEQREVGRWSLTRHDDRWGAVQSSFRVLHDVWVRDGLAVLAHWDAGTYLLDVSDPASPTHLGTVPALSPAALVDAGSPEYTASPGNHHYVRTDANNDLLGIGGESWAVSRDGELRGGPSGIELYDISEPTAPEPLSEIEPPETADPTFRGTWTTAHNFSFREGTLYSAWYQGGVKRHDISDPTAPRELSWWVAPATTRFWTAVPVAGGALLASSMGTADGAAGLWTFPAVEGTGGNPAALTAQTTAPGSTTTVDDEGTTTAGNGAADESRTASERGTTDENGRGNGETGDSETTGGERRDGGETAAVTETETPGFGVVAALGGVGVAAWLRRRRR